MNSSSSITGQILLLATFLSVMWGIYMLYTINQYRIISRGGFPRGRIVRDFRRMVVAVCLWLFVFSFVVRTTQVMLGVGSEGVGQILFFVLAGSNVAGSIFVVASLFFDDD